MLGDTKDFVGRLQAVMPKRWFSDRAPVLASVLYCIAVPWAGLYGLLQFVKAQGRICTATEAWLDLIARDFFGHSVARKLSESDQAYGKRIRANLLYPRATRCTMIAGLKNLTGSGCTVFEPTRCSDTGAYNRLRDDAAVPALGLAYGVAGGWGSLDLPYQAFITAKRTPAQISASIGGYGDNAGGYGVGAIAYLSLSALSGQVTDEDIQTAVVGLLPVNAIAWLRII